MTEASGGVVTVEISDVVEGLCVNATIGEEGENIAAQTQSEQFTVENVLFVQNESKSSKKITIALEKAKKIMLNWLNGHPTEEPPFDPDGIVIGNHPIRRRRRTASLITNGRRTRKANFCVPRKTKANIPIDDKPTSKKTRIFQVPAVPGTTNSFPNNAIRTAKYSLLTFLPKNLYEQFHRVANFYFLLVIVLQCISAISNVSPWIALMPLTSIVLATAIKDGFEDWKRHKSDNMVNYSTGRVLKRAHSPLTPLVEYSNIGGRDECKKGLSDILHSITFSIKRKLFDFTPLKHSNNDDFEINRWKDKYWRDMIVGDIVLIGENEAIPADLLIISTSEPDGRCFVETTNLDGETNLKVRFALPETQWAQSVDDAVELQMLIESEPPSNNLHSFTGKIVLPRYDTLQATEAMVSANANEILLRGCTLRNTAWAIGIVIYTGPDTKLMLNTGLTPSKRSRIERQMNPQIVLSFVLLFVMCLACAIVQGNLVSSPMVNAPYWYSRFGSRAYASAWFTGFLTFWSSMVLFQTLVPISLYITVEVCKTIQAYFIHQDAALYDAERGRKCVPRAWNISDDLGQIEYLFSDKTGTLTQNVMEFRAISIGGACYGLDEHGNDNVNNVQEPRLRREDGEWEMHEKILELYPDFVPPMQPSFVDTRLIDDVAAKTEQQSSNIIEALLILATCHTVLCEKSTELTAIQYKAQSPDEAALVRAARDLGVVFLGREQNELMVSLWGQLRTFNLLQVLEFTSARKRMSVILRERQNYVLYCKGADNVIFERLSPSANGDLVEKTMADLTKFAEKGFRTLCMGKRSLTRQEYEQWLTGYQEACNAMDGREERMEAQADMIERNLELLGATAIEDRLQEGVPKCIETLRLAGIKIWVLTGDKAETAINIGFSSRLLTSEMVLVVINGNSEDDVASQFQEAQEYPLVSNARCASVDSLCAMVIEGNSLRHALNQRLRSTFLTLACRCRTVICCRVSPLQKAKVVELVSHSRNAMTLAIGDGANDVSMLQAADIGVGVAGEEGMQAVMASDYAVTQFSHLSRLLLLHGRWSYHRAAEVTLCSFHKNIAFVVCAFWYQWACAFTSNYIYDYMYASFFNVLLAMPPILVLGCFDQDVPEHATTQYPQLYRRGIRQSSYSLSWFLTYMVNGVWQSAACFFIPRLSYGNTVLDSIGTTESQMLLGNTVGLSVITAVNVFVLLNTKSWNALVIAAFLITLVALLTMMVVCSFIHGMTLYGSVWQLRQSRFYIVVFLSIAVAVTPQLLFKLTQTILRPNDVDIIRERSLLLDTVDIERGVIRPGLEPSTRDNEETDGTQSNDAHATTGYQTTQPNTHAQPRGTLSRTLSLVADRIRRRMPALIVNMGSRRVEQHTGYAFSQQDHMANAVLLTSPIENAEKEE